MSRLNRYDEKDLRRIRPSAPAGPRAEKRMQTRKRRKREAVEWARAICVAFLVLAILRIFVVDFSVVDGPSMEGALYQGERLLVFKQSYLFSPPVRGDVVVCRFPGSGEYYVKRVIGLPGESVAVIGGNVYIDNAPLDEPYVAEPAYADFEPVIIRSSEYFVMGDNRNHSVDSRSGAVGALPKERITGKAVAVVWPPERMRLLSD